MNPQVLLISTATRWFGTARIPRALARAGFDVSLLTPKGSLAEHSRFIGKIGYLPDRATAQEWVQWASEWSGVPGTLEVREVPCSPTGASADPTRRRSITGPCRTNFRESYRALYDAMSGGASAVP